MVVDLTAEFYEPKAVIENVVYISLPVLDGHIPNSHLLKAVLDRLSDSVIYIHCGQGHGRSGLVAALLLARRGDAATPEAAIALLKSKRPKLGLTAIQYEFLCNQMLQLQD
jgi:protein-tyrosine phosphatase